MNRAKAISLFSLIFTLVSVAAYAADADRVTLVTDVDDTIKATNVLDRVYMLKYGLSDDTLAFPGMAELYRRMTTRKDLVVLSGAPSFTRPILNDFLGKSGFHTSKIIMKPMSNLQEIRENANTENFKFRELVKLAGEREGKFILIGDDGERDPEAYARFLKAYPDRVLAIYIRLVCRLECNRKVPLSVMTFTTPLDIAQAENLAHRLSGESYVRVGNALMAAADDRLLPDYLELPRYFASPKMISQLFNNEAYGEEMRSLRTTLDARVSKIRRIRYGNIGWRKYHMIYND